MPAPAIAAITACWRWLLSRAAAAAVGARVCTPMTMLARSGARRDSPDALVTIWGGTAPGRGAAAKADEETRTDARSRIMETHCTRAGPAEMAVELPPLAGWAATG